MSKTAPPASISKNAFPTHPESGDYENSEGMLLRDYFAARALPFCCIEAVKEFTHVKSTHFDAVNHAREACKRAYVIADEMMKVRNG